MAQVDEKIQIDYNHQTTYDITPSEQVGTDADFTALYPTATKPRTVPTPTGDIAYVRKFGIVAQATGCSAIANHADANQLTVVYAADGTELGRKKGSGAFTAGSTVSAQGVYCIITADGAGITVDTSLSITLTGHGLITYQFAADVLANGETITIHLGQTRNTYYDSALKYGGDRLAGVLNNSDRPYYTINEAYTALATANDDGICVLDSETYDEEIVISKSQISIYANTGQSPTITSGVGARVTREQTAVFNNLNAIFYNQNGNDTTGDGTWQNPVLTIVKASTLVGGKAYVVYGGTGATVESIYTFTAPYTLSMGTATLEPEYGYTPTFTQEPNLLYIIRTKLNDIRGFIFDGQNVSGRGIETFNTASATISDCTIKDCYVDGINLAESTGSYTGTVTKCIIYNSQDGIDIQRSGGSGTYAGTISKNIIYSCTNGINFHPNSTAVNTTVTDNICYNNSYAGFTLEEGGDISGMTFSNNTAYNGQYGLSMSTMTMSPNTFDNSIFYGNSVLDLLGNSVDSAIDYCSYGTIGGFTSITNSVTTDPQFCKISTPYKLGIASDSPCYRTDSASDNMGANLRVIEINESTITLNGLNIDLQGYYNNAVYIADSADHTDLTIKWCNLNNSQGIAIDLYDDTADTDATICNNIIESNGDGVNLTYGGNSVCLNAIYNNSNYGLYSDQTANTFNNNTFWGNSTGIYLTSNSASIVIRDSIFSGNSNYGIYSNISIIPTYCCILDAVNSNVDITSSTNIDDDPLFVSTVSGSEDFRLKRSERDTIVSSPCIEASSTGGDMGAYDEDAVVENDSWKKYTVSYNPTKLNEGSEQKSLTTDTDNLGNILTYMHDDKIRLPLDWTGASASNKTQRLKIKHFQNRIPSRKNALTERECEFRVHPVPESLYGTGTATVSSSAKTLTDSTASFIEDEKKGWHVGIKLKEGTGSTISASGKTLTKVGDFTGVDYTGYFLYIEGNYFYIISNTDDVLTLSDVNGYLVDKSSYAYSLVKNFKVTTSDETTITVVDDDSELVDGSYSYYFDFVLCKAVPSNFSTNQPYFDFLKDDDKNDYSITFEEID